jgi:tetrapyrrole methylase family protein/MazG family protein
VTPPRIVVVGLGPGHPRHVTAETLDAIERIPHRALRTRIHPSAHLVPDAVDFDHRYLAADRFDEVYAGIVEDLVELAARHGELLYAVPGSPLVLERTVRQLLTDERVEVEVLPAMSFLDVAYARLGIDPVEAGVRLVDGHEFAVAAAGERGPLLIAHCHADWVLSEIKLAVDDADLDGGADDTEVVILQRLGTDEERITRTTWAELDRTVEADHLTSLYVPHLGVPVGAEYVRFHRLARTLREQCPWDVEQTHRSLVPYLIEEAYEVVDAIEHLDPEDPATDEHLVEELGDLLYQIEFHATIAEQEGRFTIADVARGVHDKLVRRHPHVFGPSEATEQLGLATVEAGSADATADVLDNWERIKQAEKQRTGLFDGIPGSLPSLTLAHEVQRKAAKVGFDWPDLEGPVAKIAEEVDEVRGELAAGGDPDRLRHEVGDLLFAVVNVARHLDVDAESALRAAAQRFRGRVTAVADLAAAEGANLREADLATLDRWWEQVKQSQRDERDGPAARDPRP